MFEKLMPKHREIWEHDSLASFVPIGRESNTSRCCTTVALGSRDWDLRVILDQASKIVLVGICHSHLAQLVPPRPIANCQTFSVPHGYLRSSFAACITGAPKVHLGFHFFIRRHAGLLGVWYRMSRLYILWENIN